MTDAVVHLPVKLELMSRFHNRNFELLEPYDAKVSRTVLRGEGSSNAPDLLDVVLRHFRSNQFVNHYFIGTVSFGLILLEIPELR